MHPAQRVVADGELACLVAEDYCIAQEAVRRDRPPQRAFRGDADRIGRDLQCADAELIEMRLPGRMIGKARPRRRRQLADHRPGEPALAHVGERRAVDDVIG